MRAIAEHAPDNKCLSYSFFRGGGALEPSVEPSVGCIHDRCQIGSDRLHAQAAGICVHDGLGGVISLLPHRRDRRCQLVHLCGEVGLERQQPCLLVGARAGGLLQIDHKLREALYRPLIWFNRGLLPRNQETTLSALGILHRLTDGVCCPNGLEAEDSICSS